MGYKSFQEGAAIGSTLLNLGLSVRDIRKDQEKDELEKKAFSIANELSKNAKARQADPSIPEYRPPVDSPEDAKAAWKGGLMFAEKMAADLNLDNSRMENQAKKARSNLDEAAKKTRVFMALNDPAESANAFKDIYNNHMATGNTITEVSEDGTATFVNRDGKTSTKKLTKELMANTLNNYFSDPKEALSKRVSSIQLTKQQNRDRLYNAQLLERETKDGKKEYMWKVQGLVNPETMDEIEPPYYTKSYPPYDTTKLKEDDIGDMSQWRAVDSAETPTEAKKKDLGMKSLEQGLATSKQQEKTSAATEQKIIQETKNLANKPAKEQTEAERKLMELRVKREKETIDLAKTDMGYSEQLGLSDEKSDGFKLFTKATSLLFENVDPDKITPAKAFTGVKEIITEAEKYAESKLKDEDKEDPGYNAKKIQIMNEFVEFSLGRAEEGESNPGVDIQGAIEASKAKPPKQGPTVGERIDNRMSQPKPTVPQPTPEQLKKSPLQDFVENAGALSPLEKRRRMEAKKQRDLKSFVRKPPGLY